MKKHFRIISLFTLLSMVTLAFASQNNFGFNFANWGQMRKKMSKQEVLDKLNTNLIAPVKDALEVRDPHMFMTKCYSSLEADIRGENIVDLQYDIYDDQTIIGNLVLEDCGDISTICKYKFDFTNDSLTVRESFLAGWTQLEDLTDKIAGIVRVEE